MGVRASMSYLSSRNCVPSPPHPLHHFRNLQYRIHFRPPPASNSPMPKMKIAVVPKPGADFELLERDIPQPGPSQVRVRVQACGICLGDHLVKDGLWPGLTYPRAPGHEIAGVIAGLG